MNPFRSLPEYERFVYTLQHRHSCVLHATLTVARRSRGLAIVAGELHFAHGYRLVVAEIITWDQGPLAIQHYAMKSGAAAKSSTGMTRNRIPTSLSWQALIHTTNTFRRTRQSPK